MITAYNRERLTKPQDHSAGQPRPTAILDQKTAAKEDRLDTVAQVDLIINIITTTTTIALPDRKPNADVWHTNKETDPWTGGQGDTKTVVEEVYNDTITKTVKLFAKHIRETEAKGGMVNINETNVIDNVLVHTWGKLLREELGRTTERSPSSKIKTLEDVRVAGEDDVCITLKDRVRLNLSNPSTDSSHSESAYEGNVYNMANGGFWEWWR